jgi:serine/threonine protein kinase
MIGVPASLDRPEAPLFSDGLGDRVVAVDGATGDLLQILRLRPQLVGVPSFEFALRERSARLANFRHAYYARVRRIDRHPSGLAIVSDHVEGIRLSDILRVAAERQLPLDLNAALCIIRQLVPAVALLHENARDVAHGLLAPERLLVTPHARVVIVEHVLGSAIEQLQYTRDRLWQELRVAMPPSAGMPRFDHRADVTAAGVIALSLVVGRPLQSDDYPQNVSALLSGARARSAMGDERPLPGPLRNWLARMLQIDPRYGFASAAEAQAAFETVLAEETSFGAAPVALETFLSRYISTLLDPSTPVPVSAAVQKPAPSVPRPGPQPVAPRPVDAAAAPPAAKPTPAPTPATASSAQVERHSPPPAQSSAPPVPAVAQATDAPPAPIVAKVPEVREPVAAPIAEPAEIEPAAFDAPDITELLRGLDNLTEMTDEDLAPRTAVTAPAIAFAEANDPMADVPRRSGGRARVIRIAAVLLAVGVIGAGGYVAMRTTAKPMAPLTGTLSVQTNPPGAAVFVDGVAHGNTPARLSLPPGAHIVELRGRGVPRVLPVSVTAGAEASQYLELPETPALGSLLVQSDPPGAGVKVDGVDHGKAPASIADLAPGDHVVVLQAEGSQPVTQHVVIQAGVTSSVLSPVSVAAAGPVSGWITIKAPFTMEVHEGGRLLGTSDTDRIMLSAGRHDVQLVNETLGYRANRAVQVPPGKVQPITIDPPQGTININATPWAEVWIDDRRVGETPIGNLAVPIGPHEIVFRHPQFGEKHQAVSVTLNAPVRISMDMK